MIDVFLGYLPLSFDICLDLHRYVSGAVMGLRKSTLEQTLQSRETLYDKSISNLCMSMKIH